MNLRKNLPELQPLPLDERGFPRALVRQLGDLALWKLIREAPLAR
jgi:hypothetical protein